MEGLVEMWQYLQLEVSCVKKLVVEKTLNKDKGKETTKEYHNNGGIKSRTIRKVQRETISK